MTTLYMADIGKMFNFHLLISVGNEYSPGTALNTFLREKRISVGTKHMCFQGGCGSCLVETKLFEPISEDKLSYAVNSVNYIRFSKSSRDKSKMFFISAIEERIKQNTVVIHHSKYKDR